MPGDRPYSADELALMTPEDASSVPPSMQQALIQALLARAGQQQAQPQQPQGPQPLDQYAMLASLSPERRAELAAMGTLDEQGQALEGQLAQAQALQSRPTAQRGTLGGAIGSGLGGVVDALRGGLAEKDVRAQQAALLRRKDKGRADYNDDVVRFYQQQKQQVAPGLGAADVGMLPPGMG